MFLFLAAGVLDQVQRGFAVASGKRPGEGFSGHAVFLDRVDHEPVFGDVIEGSDDDHHVGFELGHCSSDQRHNDERQRDPRDPLVARTTPSFPRLQQPGQYFDKHEGPPWLLSLKIRRGPQFTGERGAVAEVWRESEVRVRCKARVAPWPKPPFKPYRS